jgi:hypothetical protein
MRQIETFHYTFSGAGAHTFTLGANPNYELLVKNMSDGVMLVSYGTEIDTENDSYISVLPKTAEILSYKASGENEEQLSITVSAESAGTIEIRVVD